MDSEIILQVQFAIPQGNQPMVQEALRDLRNPYFSYLIKEAENQLLMRVQASGEGNLADAIKYLGPSLATIDSLTNRLSLVAVGLVPAALKTSIQQFQPQYISHQEYVNQYQGLM
ncbi:MAG: hypothetical protein AAFQ98_00185 [Bacteroidota bacterium]